MITVGSLNDAQMLLLAREARLASREDTDGTRRFQGVGRIFDILESVVISDDDKDFLMELTVKGKLELKDLMDFVTAFDEEQKPKVRRGRPPKNVTE
jgi:hypothetical protein